MCQCAFCFQKKKMLYFSAIGSEALLCGVAAQTVGADTGANRPFSSATWFCRDKVRNLKAVLKERGELCDIEASFFYAMVRKVAKNSNIDLGPCRPLQVASMRATAIDKDAWPHQAIGVLPTYSS